MPTTPTSPPSLTAAPTSPDRADRATFTARAIALDNWTKNNQVPELGALATNLFDNATVAYNAASTATIQAGIATAKAGLTAADALQTAADRTASGISLAAVQALYLQFSDQYLGSLAADPALDNHGNALTNGDFYINSATGYLRAYTVAGGWVQGISATAGVASINALTGAITLKTINGTAITGSGNIVTNITRSTYDNRADLRALSPGAGELRMVEGLGVFVWISASTEPDDDETAFATSGGVWELAIADPDYVFASGLAELDRLQGQVDDLSAATAAKFLRSSFTMSLTSLTATTSVSFDTTVSGANIGDSVIVNSGDSFGTSTTDMSRLSMSAYVSAANTVTTSIRNASASGASMTASTWSILVIKQ